MMKAVALSVLLAGGVLAGCATAPDGGDGYSSRDPYEDLNRHFFAMNRRMDRTFLRPIAETYVELVPERLRAGLHTLLTTANLPVVFANDMLQARPSAAGETVERLVVNVALGLGVYDTASAFGIAEHDNDFGRTLGVWGWNGEPYLMLPLIGPSNPRDVIGFAGDIVLDPAIYLQYKYFVWSLIGRQGLGLVDMRARNLSTVDAIERSSLDYYATTRSLYRQYRQNQVEQAPDVDADDEAVAEGGVNLP
ncbi:MAG: VacJ family lipoprotein [Rhizomicrobium sp.]